MKHVTHFNEWREPAPDTEYVTLYRGDSATFKTLSIDKTRTDALFNQGLYFTDNIEVAKSYMDKGGVHDNVRWSIADPTLSKEEVINLYARDQVGISHNVKRYLEYFSDEVPASISVLADNPEYDMDKVDRYIQDHPEDWRQMVMFLSRENTKSDDVSDTKFEKVASGWRMVRYSRMKPNLTVLNVPKEWLEKCLNTDKVMSRKELELCLDLATSMRDAYQPDEKWYERFEKSRRDAEIMIQTKRRISFANFYTDYLPYYALENEDRVPVILRRVFKKHGYKGLRYDGGKRIPGEYGKHSAYVFWDENSINKLIGRQTSHD